MKFHFFADWLNAVSILLSLFCVQHDHSIQYNFREEDSLFLRYSIRSSSFYACTHARTQARITLLNSATNSVKFDPKTEASVKTKYPNKYKLLVHGISHG